MGEAESGKRKRSTRPSLIRLGFSFCGGEEHDQGEWEGPGDRAGKYMHSGGVYIPGSARGTVDVGVFHEAVNKRVIRSICHFF